MMEVMNLANGQVGICHFETRSCFSSSYSWNPYTSCGFSISRRPIMGVSSNTKRVRTFGLRIRALSKGESGNSSVGGGIIEKEFEFKPSFNDYLKAMEFVKTGKEKKQAHELNGHNLEHQPKENSTKTLGRDESGVKLRRFGGSMDREKIEEEDRGGVTVRENEVNAELDYREKKNGNSNVKTGGKEIRADANVNTKLIGAQVDGRRLSIRTTSMKSNLESFNFGKGVRSSNAAESSSAFDDIISRASTVGTRKRFSHGKDTPQVLEGKGRAFQMEESGSRGNRRNDKLVSHPSQVDKRSLRRNSQNYENSNNNSLEVERAAFKNIEGLDEVICKPHTAKREMEERIQKLAKWLNGADIDMPEWMFSKSMRSAKIRYTDHSILRIVQLLGKLGNWRRVLQLIEWLQMRERYKSNRLRNVYTTALNVLGKARRPVEALNVFRVMQQQTSTYPDIIAYRCIAVTLGQAGHMKELFDVIDSMRSPPKKKSKLEELKKWDPRLEPDIVVYHAVLNACVQRKQWEGAFWVLQQLKLQGQQPSTSTYGLIMEVMLACGKYNLVHEFFRKVKRSSSNALVYRVLVNTLWREGKTDETVLAVQDMERRGIVGSAALYYDLARCLISAGRCQEALLQIEKICKVANKPLVVTYTGLIQACLDAGNIQNAVFVFNQMKHFCSPNLVTCNIMLKAYIDHGLYEKASELFNNMLEDGKKICSTSDHEVRVFPDIYTFNTMLDACIAGKRWDDFERIYRRMLHHGYHFNEKRHLRMILDASRAGKGELLEITRKHLYLTDRSVPPSLMKERFCVMLERDDIDAALACIVTNSAGESQAYSKTAWSKLFGENGLRFRKDTLIRLMDEVSMLVAKSDAPNQVLESLSASCKAFLRNQGQVKLVHETNTTDFVCSVQTETTLTS